LGENTRRTATTTEVDHSVAQGLISEEAERKLVHVTVTPKGFKRLSRKAWSGELPD
jgi:hypothetical protein